MLSPRSTPGSVSVAVQDQADNKYIVSWSQEWRTNSNRSSMFFFRAIVTIQDGIAVKVHAVFAREDWEVCWYPEDVKRLTNTVRVALQEIKMF